MSLINPKNRLQEFCQRNSIALPIYDDCRLENGEYYCKCTILYRQHIFVGNGTSKKLKEAEKMSADDVLLQLHRHQLSQVRLVSRSDLERIQGYVVIYIDMENINVNELSELLRYNKYDPTQYLFRGVLSIGHHYSETNFVFDGIAFEKILVPSTRSDAADIGMIMHAMSSVSSRHNMENIPRELIFVSRDRFSCVFIELCEKGFCMDNRNIKVVHCSNVLQLKGCLDMNAR